jgi:hypothetical protein
VSPVPHVRHTGHRHAWLRILVVCVVLLVVGAHTEAVAAPPARVSAEACGAEYDVLDAALRPPATQGHRAVAPLRPGPRTDGRPSEPGRRPTPSVPASYSPALHALHTVVLRC